MLEIFLHCFRLSSLLVLEEMLRVCSSDINSIFDVGYLRKFCKSSVQVCAWFPQNSVKRSSLTELTIPGTAVGKEQNSFIAVNIAVVTN